MPSSPDPLSPNPAPPRPTFIRRLRWHWRMLMRLVRHNPLATLLGFLLLNLLGIKRVFRLVVRGEAVWLRSATPDYDVAVHSLGGEFNTLIAGLSPDASGLIIDGGGYIGTVAMRFARAFPNCRILTLEPSSENLALLRRNLAHLGNVTIIPKAIAGRSGSAPLFDVGNREWGYSLLAWRHSDHHILETVETTTIAELIDGAGFARAFVVKLDIEGAERDLLLDPGPWLGRTDVLVMELHERLVPGTMDAYAAATAQRRNWKLEGEKHVSMA
ncbi:MAG: FkbM family methyltransferase [Devosia sp.]